jgi:DNA replication protein DnaC
MDGIITKERVEAIKTSILGKFCNGVCNSTGVIFDGESFQDCTCVKEFNRVIKLSKAGIPKKHWEFDLRNLTSPFVEENKVSLGILKMYCKKIIKMTDEGVGIFLQGESGLAKSALAYYILKEAIKQNILCYSIRMSHLSELLVNSLRNENDLDVVNWLKNDVKLLLIDEIEKDYKIDNPNSFMGSQVNTFFSDIYDMQKSLIVTSNIPKKNLKQVHASNVADRLHELVDVILVGESYRKPGEFLNRIMKG